MNGASVGDVRAGLAGRGLSCLRLRLYEIIENYSGSSHSPIAVRPSDSYLYIFDLEPIGGVIEH